MQGLMGRRWVGEVLPLHCQMPLLGGWDKRLDLFAEFGRSAGEQDPVIVLAVGHLRKINQLIANPTAFAIRSTQVLSGDPRYPPLTMTMGTSSSCPHCCHSAALRAPKTRRYSSGVLMASASSSLFLKCGSSAATATQPSFA